MPFSLLDKELDGFGVNAAKARALKAESMTLAPPMWMAYGSPASYRLAGEMGVGCLSFTISAPEGLNTALAHYREEIKVAKPVGDFINNNIAGFTTLYFGESLMGERIIPKFKEMAKMEAAAA